jgi:hypothetical protein
MAIAALHYALTENVILVLRQTGPLLILVARVGPLR